MIPFNKPYITEDEQAHVEDVLKSRKLSGNRKYTRLCQSFFEKNYGFGKCLMTTSCTDALEMAAILLDLKKRDEVLVPSYTFVSTANAFLMHGATVRFVDSLPDSPNMDPRHLESLISEKTRAIVVMHYAGIANDMDKITALVKEHDLILIEDAAQAIDSYYKSRPLGGFGAMSTFSFHETKNITSGEGGMLAINDSRFVQRAEIIWEKGTNRSAFSRGEVDKYNWLDIGSSFLASELNAAVLYGQIEKLPVIQNRRIAIWERYFENLMPLEDKGYLQLPEIPSFAYNNGHLFYILLPGESQRDRLIDQLGAKGIKAVFHYLSLHNSPYFIQKHDGRPLPYAENYSARLLRLPLYYELTDTEIDYVCEKILEFFENETTIRVASGNSR